MVNSINSPYPRIFQRSIQKESNYRRELAGIRKALQPRALITGVDRLQSFDRREIKFATVVQTPRLATAPSFPSTATNAPSLSRAGWKAGSQIR